MSIEFESIEQVAEAMDKFNRDFQDRQAVVSTTVLQPFASALALIAKRLEKLEEQSREIASL